MPKYWEKQIFSHGGFPEVGEKQKTQKKERKKKKKVGKNNGQLRLIDVGLVQTQSDEGSIKDPKHITDRVLLLSFFQWESFSNTSIKKKEVEC